MSLPFVYLFRKSRRVGLISAHITSYCVCAMARKRINKAALRQQIQELDIDNELKAQLLEAVSERKTFGLVWEEKEEEAQERLREELPVFVEDESKRIVNSDEAPNHIVVEGDNLHALTALTFTHEGKIDVIYIDPPYNTGNRDFVYNDSFVDTEDSYRHSKWLSFMAKRLKIAKKLLSERGVIFISIDDNEQANLKLLCDEVFGNESYVACIGWQRTYSTRNDSKGIPKEIESLLVYSKQALWTPKKLPRTDKMNSLYKSPDNDPKPWTSSSVSAPGAATHQGMVYAIQHPFTGEMMYPTIGRCWSLGQDSMLDNLNQWAKYKLADLQDYDKRAEICGMASIDVRRDVLAIVLDEELETAKKSATDVLNKGNWPYFYFTNGGKGGLRRKTYLDDMEGRVVTNFFNYEECGHTDEAKKEIVAIFDGKAPFDTPKPTRLLKRIEQISTDKDSLILDFFAGSGTTLHATMMLNAEDGGNRQCILVSNDESNICEDVTYERNKRVINGYTKPNGDLVEGFHHNNLRFYRTKFVPRESSISGKRKLMAASTDLLCIKNDIYDEKPTFGNITLRPHLARYFDNGKQKMLIIFREEAVESLVSEIEAMPADTMIKVYVFSVNNYAMDEDFATVADKVNLCALPSAIYNAYLKVLPKKLNNAQNEDEEENA